MTNQALAQARQCYQSGEPNRVEELCRLVLRDQPANVKALYLLGSACYELGRLDEALVHFQKILQLCPKSARAHQARGSLLLQRGDLDEAVRSFHEAVRLRPGWGAARISLGMALQALGKLAEAYNCYLAAVCLDPRSVAALINLGALLLNMGKLPDAAEAFTAALHLQPDCAEAHYNLGTVLYRRKQHREAIDSYRQAIRLSPDFLAAHNALAKALLDDGQHRGAQECIQQTLRLEPNQPEAHATLGKLLLQQGRREEAERSFREALRQHPTCVSALAAVAIHDVFPLSRTELSRIKSLLAAPGLPPTGASLLHFAAGSIMDRAGVYDEAYSYFREANALRRQAFHETGSGFDPEAHHALIDQFVAACDAGYHQRLPGLGRTTERPVFIVGMPQSGTALVEQLLASHPDVFAAGELPDISRLVAELSAQVGPAAAYPQCLSRLDRNTAARLADQYLEKLAQLHATVLRVTDRMPLNFLHLGLIAALFPRARIIHCVRNPLDVCLCCFLHFSDDAFSCDLGELGRFYLDYQRLMAHWRKGLPAQLMDVTYEELVEDQEAVTRRLLAFCGLSWHDGCTISLKTTDDFAAGHWRHYAPYLEPLFDSLEQSFVDPSFSFVSAGPIAYFDVQEPGPS
jgi:tetratricopeptide (TPR) repeat protein